MLMQSLNDAVLGLLTFAPLFQLTRIQRLAEGDRQLPGTWPGLSRRHRFVRAADEYRYDRYGEAVEKYPDTRPERLQLTGVRAVAFGEPHQLLLALQDGSPEGQTREDCPVGVDRHYMPQATEQALQRIAEGGIRSASPVNVAKMTVVERSSNRARVEGANMVGRQYKRAFSGQMLEALYAHAEHSPRDRTVEGEHPPRRRRLDRPEGFERTLLILAQNRFGLLEGQGLRFAAAACFGLLGHLVQQFADRIDAPDRLLAQLYAGALVDLERQVHPSERVDAEVELRARFRCQVPIGVAPGEQIPNLPSRRVLE